MYYYVLLFPCIGPNQKHFAIQLRKTQCQSCVIKISLTKQSIIKQMNLDLLLFLLIDFFIILSFDIK